MSYRYRFISEHRTEFGVQRLCQVLGLRRQGFHEWVAAEAGRARRAAAPLTATRRYSAESATGRTDATSGVVTGPLPLKRSSAR